MIPFGKLLHEIFEPERQAALLVAEIAFAGIQTIILWVMIRAFFGTTLPRAIVIWVFALIEMLMAIALVVWVVGSYVLHAYVVSANAMAPTLVGWHKTAACPTCGGLLIVPAPSPESPMPFVLDDEQRAICATCRRTAMVHDSKSPVDPPDRFAVIKLVRPRRWDMIALRAPTEPERQYVFRVVGLPGETVYIRDGAVWVDDVRIEPPPQLNGLRYSRHEADANLGTPDAPWQLQPDEYCVLGDFSDRSMDSRFWGPVPESHIEGVVTLCYWPVSRWRVFR
jgi:signal peptidase I